jgi:hypothetical protein
MNKKPGGIAAARLFCDVTRSSGNYGASHPFSADIPMSERFRAKWMPVRVKKTRQNKNLEPVLIPSEPEKL